MSIAKKLVDAMGGTIEVSSRVGEGSTFQITIPFEVAQAPGGEGAGDGLLCADGGAGSDARAAKKPAQPQVDLAGMNLPMAEDNELNAEIASTLPRASRAGPLNQPEHPPKHPRRKRHERPSSSRDPACRRPAGSQH